MGAQISQCYDYISLEMPASENVLAGDCWDTNPGWGKECFLSPSVEPTAPQQCRPNVAYFDQCIPGMCPRAHTTRAECAELCAATKNCAVFTTNTRGQCYLRASAEDPRCDDPARGTISCPMQIDLD